jgi:hypothetical protein
LTSQIAYFRWHGHGTRPWYDYHYQAEELRPWAPKVQEAAYKVEKVYGYFNNHYHGYAVENCLQIMEMAGVLDPKQIEVKNRIERYRKATAQTTYSTLEAFSAPKDMNFESLINYFVPPERLKRAEQILDSDLTITKQANQRLEARLREYHIVIDAKEKMILHDCADWERVSSTRKLCKHLAKLFLSIDREEASRILRNLYQQEETWQFKPYQPE